MEGKVIVLAGPSGAGKGRICEELLARRKNMRKVLSVTTRAKREDDIGKETYIFTNEEAFLKMKDEGKFLETNYYDGAWYGTTEIPTEELTERDLIFDKDVNGALAIKEEYPNAITFYILPIDKETLLKRRGNRGEGRTKIAMEEIPKAKELDYLIINDDIYDAVRQVEIIIESMRICSMKSKKNIEFMDNFYN